ncbi:YidB family protein [Streptomyces sp. NPDC014724]|uniref:YidB family protein n=1 Tax=unclassified Streptomyces TaxID=2593676 RepID=UPI0036F71EB1
MAENDLGGLLGGLLGGGQGGSGNALEGLIGRLTRSGLVDQAHSWISPARCRRRSAD